MKPGPTQAERWARKVLPKIAAEYGISNPRLNWRQSRKGGVKKVERMMDGKQVNVWVGCPRFHSSGVCQYGLRAKITVTQGTDLTDAKMVFLHEMAHAITPGHHHGYKFYYTAWTLYRQYKLPIAHCKSRDGKKGAGRKAYLDTRAGKPAEPTFNSLSSLVSVSSAPLPVFDGLMREFLG